MLIQKDMDAITALNYLSTIGQRFTNRSNIQDVNKAIESYDQCWNYVKDTFPNRVDIDFLHVRKISIPLLALGIDSIKYQRDHLQNNAKILREILEAEINQNEDVSKRIKNNPSNDKPTVNFNIGKVVNSQFQQGNQFANQTIEINAIRVNELESILNSLIHLLEKSNVPLKQKQELYADINTVEIQIKSPKPKISIISESLSSIVQILSMANTGSSVITTLIDKITSWLGGSN